MEDNIDIVQMIKLYRFENEVTLTQLAKDCGISYPTLQRICARKGKPNLLTQAKILKVIQKK